ncbi:MAG: hypothetical protein Q7T93_16675 [Methylobacterium sp.]|uniref:hypothetical protein n=1 Tax=Methylobacterium sp. TaxID=409 RepID=UPI00271EF525|nr:hypothetical protein [Methylobacterium sp.]MDO9428453.1 hypothetical protein [Methylobacterium sp.]
MSAITRWARLDGSVVFEVINSDPEGRFDPSLLWVACPADTQQGATYDAKKGTFTNPPAPEPVEPAPSEPAYRTVMTPIRFKAQFSVQEQVAIKRARAYQGGADPDAASDERKAFARDALDILFGSLDDPRLAEVDVADPSVVGGIDFVRSLGILTDERADAIKRGAPAAV